MYRLPPEFSEPGTPFKAIIERRRLEGAVPVDIDGDYAEHVLRPRPIRRDERCRPIASETGGWSRSRSHRWQGGGFVAIHQDITEDIRSGSSSLKASRAELRSRTSARRRGQQHQPGPLHVRSAKERLVICNEPYARIYNLPPELMQPGTHARATSSTTASTTAWCPRRARDAYIDEPQAPGRPTARRGQGRHRAQDGRTIMIHHHPMKDGGWVATHEDITEQRQQEARIRHLARHDALTDLPNRIQLPRGDGQGSRARIERGEMVAVLCIDLDHFKAVNDTLGHAVGDEVLKQVAARLRGAARETDIVARLGGDEFALLAQAARRAAAMPRRSPSASSSRWRSRFTIDGQQITIGASVGIAMAPADGDDAETLLKNADLALYRAKSEGRGDLPLLRDGHGRGAAAAPHARAGPARSRWRAASSGWSTSRCSASRTTASAASRRCCAGTIPSAARSRRSSSSRSPRRPASSSPIGEWVLREACKAAASWPEHVARRGQPLAGPVQEPRARRPRDLGARAMPGSPPTPARARDHRVAAARRHRARRSRRCTGCARSASASRWTISAPATRR